MKCKHTDTGAVDADNADKRGVTKEIPEIKKTGGQRHPGNTDQKRLAGQINTTTGIAKRQTESLHTTTLPIKANVQ